MPGEAHYFVAQLDGLDAAGFAEGGGVGLADLRVGGGRRRGGGRGSATRAGAVTLEPQDVMDLGRTAIFADPAGPPFAVWQPGRRAGLGVVNAPGSWNWSNLHARDLDGAARFYGAVFGWEASTIEFGPGMESTMFRLPGYGDFLAERDPGLRERHADPSVPPGFSDAVAWVEPLAADGAGALARHVLRGRHGCGRRARGRAGRRDPHTRRSTPARCGWPRCATRRAPRSA